MTNPSDCPPDCPDCTPQYSVRYTNHFGKQILQPFFNADAAMDRATLIDETASANGLIQVFYQDHGVALFGCTASQDA